MSSNRSCRNRFCLSTTLTPGTRLVRYSSNFHAYTAWPWVFAADTFSRRQWLSNSIQKRWQKQTWVDSPLLQWRAQNYHRKHYPPYFLDNRQSPLWIDCRSPFWPFSRRVSRGWCRFASSGVEGIIGEGGTTHYQSCENMWDAQEKILFAVSNRCKKVILNSMKLLQM